MPERIPNAAAKTVVFRAISSTDHFTPTTGKTIAITISKNGGAFGNLNAGATNATEMTSGFYKFTLDTTDTGTDGPLAWRGAGTGIDDTGDVFEVVNSTNAGFTALPNEIADAILARNVSGGSSTGRTVKQALHVLRNKVTVSGGTMTVYDTDDASSSWTASVTGTEGADPITTIDPA